MKRIGYIIFVFIFFTRCSPVVYTSTPRPAYNPPPQPAQNYNLPPQNYNDHPQTDQVFYDELSPYGQWIDYPDYGYVWQPNVGPDFRPYDTNGQWVYSDAGWTWVSNYSWGWAPFHYGRWFYDGNYGWLWEPGRQWAPAWVTWGQSGDYYGWAPVPPRVAVNESYRPRDEDWNFVPAARINQVNVTNYVVRNNVTVINKTTIINNVTNNTTINNVTTNNNVTNNHITNNNITNNNLTNNNVTNNVTNNNITNNRTANNVVYNRGPKVSEVENITNLKIQPVKINDGTKPGTSLGNNQLTVYRPVIKQNAPQAAGKPSPQKVVSYNTNNTNPPRQNLRGSNGAAPVTEPEHPQSNGQKVNNPVAAPKITQPNTDRTNGTASNQNTVSPPAVAPKTNRQIPKPITSQNQQQTPTNNRNTNRQNPKPAGVQNPNQQQVRQATQKPNQQLKPGQKVNPPKNNKNGKDTTKRHSAVPVVPADKPQN